VPRKWAIAASTIGGFTILTALATALWYFFRRKYGTSSQNSNISSRYELPDSQVTLNRFRRSIHEIGVKDEQQLSQSRSHCPAHSESTGHSNARCDPNPPDYFCPFGEYVSNNNLQSNDQPLSPNSSLPSGSQEFCFKDDNESSTELADQISQTFVHDFDSVSEAPPQGQDNRRSHSSISGKNSWDTLVNVAPGTAL
jgi:hypothetical protein